MRHSSWTMAGVLVVVAGLVSPAEADEDALKGLKAVKVEVVVGTDVVRACTGDRAEIAKQTAGTLSTAGLSANDQATILFTVEISSERRQGNCQYSYDVSVHKAMKVMLPELGREVLGEFVLWDDDDDDLTAVLARFTQSWKKVQ